MGKAANEYTPERQAIIQKMIADAAAAERHRKVIDRALAVRDGLIRPPWMKEAEPVATEEGWQERRLKPILRKLWPPDGIPPSHLLPKDIVKLAGNLIMGSSFLDGKCDRTHCPAAGRLRQVELLNLFACTDAHNAWMRTGITAASSSSRLCARRGRRGADKWPTIAPKPPGALPKLPGALITRISLIPTSVLKLSVSAALATAGIDRQAFTIQQFCSRNGDLSGTFLSEDAEAREGSAGAQSPGPYHHHGGGPSSTGSVSVRPRPSKSHQQQHESVSGRPPKKEAGRLVTLIVEWPVFAGRGAG